VFNKITPISTSRTQGLQTTPPVILIFILLVWIGLPVVAWSSPGSLTTQAGDARGAAQNTAEEFSLEPGKPVERELSGGQSHFYKISMTTGQYLQVTVSQLGIDALVALFTPEGKKIGEADIEKATVRSEIISAIAEATGAYRIEVRSAEKTAGAGRYEIRIEALKMATAEDKHHVAADLAFREAKQLENGPAEDKRKSIEKYQKALELYRKAGAGKRIADALNNIGMIHLSLGETHKAMDRYNEALPICRELGDLNREAITLTNIGTAYWSLGELQNALAKFSEALPLSRAVKDQVGEAENINNIGVIHHSLGQLHKALEKYDEALRIYRAAGDRKGEGDTLHNLGGIYSDFGERQKALEILNEALQVSRIVGDRNGVAITLADIGGLYRVLGEMERALEKFSEALLLSRELGDRGSEAEALSGIGSVYSSFKYWEKALETYNNELAIRRATGNRGAEALALNNIGNTYRYSGDFRRALEKYNEALRLGREIGSRVTEAAALHNSGTAHRLLGEAQKAMENYGESLNIKREMGNRDGEATTLLGIALLEQGRGALPRARQAIEQAIAIIESQRAGIHVRGLRDSYFASRRECYESYIDILMEQHKQNPAAEFDAVAFEVSERARARSLLELLRESRIDIRQGVDSSLLEREHYLQQLLNAKASAQFALLNRKHTRAQAEAAAKEITAITTEYEELRGQISARNPRYAALTQPQPLSLGEVQRQVLDPDTLLLEYSLGDNASYLFVVSPTSIASHQLPKRAEIEAATRRVRELLTAPQRQPGDTEAKYRARIKEARASYWSQAAVLSRMLLGPAAPRLGGKRLLIVADGALQYLPFGALPAPETERRKDGETMGQGDRGTRGQGKSAIRDRQSAILTPLVVNHEIVHLPSASALAVLRRELAGREPSAKAVAVLADPVFSADDARVKSSDKSRASEELPPELTRSINDVRGELRRLLMTRDEAKAILSVTPRTDGFGALDFRANRATATGEELSRYRIVHFATHGLLNSEHPGLSGVVLSLVDERGQPQDGFLRLHQIFNLRLPAELVVLSACQTGLGKEIKGEGLVGLTRGFMYAGAARVVASLWQVNDAATAELMKRFYHSMLKDGMRPAAALRVAQIEMWKKPQWKSPFYWGGFVLQGEWK
jgi:CHAT domain-containing protein/uncharacterized protein HemY